MAASTPPQRTPQVQRPTITAAQKAFRPFGSAYELLYNKDPVVGASGPAGTGKSRTCLEKLHIIAEKYPGSRLLIARKTRESLSEAALFTYEEKVLPEGHAALSGPRRSHRQQYHYTNGSTIVVCGLDKPQKIMSTEYDVIYVQEAIECDNDDFEMLTTRLRNGKVPYQQLIFDCNPDKPLHWIYQGSLKGRWKLIQSTHEDNPTLWEEAPADVKEVTEHYPDRAADGRIGRWTVNGVRYIAVLEDLTGPRYWRLRHGKWVGAEGVVYAFDQAIHTWDARKVNWPDASMPPREWRRIWAVDFGFTHPFCLQKWAIDPDGRAWMYFEIYQTQTLVEDSALEALRTSGWCYDEEAGHIPIDADPDPLPEAVVCDWDGEGRATLEKYTGLRTTAAFKGIASGIQAFQKRLRVAGDGLARIFFYRDAIHKVDNELKDKVKPTCTIEEFDGYVWDKADGRKQGEVPVDKDNHGMDPARYLVAYIDSVTDGDLKAKDVPMAAAAEVTSQVVACPRKKPERSPYGSSSNTRKTGRAGPLTGSAWWPFGRN